MLDWWGSTLHQGRKQCKHHPNHSGKEAEWSRPNTLCNIPGLVGEYAGLVGEYAGLVGEYAAETMTPGLEMSLNEIRRHLNQALYHQMSVQCSVPGLVGEYPGLVGE